MNPYITEYPELMAGKTVVYVHGFASSGQSGTVSRLRTVMPQARIVAPDLPVRPAEALQLLHDLCRREQPSLILGTSMGGMYAEQLHGYDRICVNPAFEMAETMKSHGMMGQQTFQNPRQDGVQEFIVNKALVKEYKEATELCFSQPQAEQQRVYGLFGDRDTAVDTYDVFHRHYPQAIRFHGEHRMNDHSFMQSVVPVIRWIDDRQEQRQRPIIYIGVSLPGVVPGQEGHASLQGGGWGDMAKTVRQLIERYQVYFVVPALSADPAAYAAASAWLENRIGVPAWGGTPSSPTAVTCSTATTSSPTSPSQTPWPPRFTSAATSSRPGTTSPPTSPCSEANSAPAVTPLPTGEGQGVGHPFSYHNDGNLVMKMQFFLTF